MHSVQQVAPICSSSTIRLSKREYTDDAKPNRAVLLHIVFRISCRLLLESQASIHSCYSNLCSLGEKRSSDTAIEIDVPETKRRLFTVCNFVVVIENPLPIILEDMAHIVARGCSFTNVRDKAHNLVSRTICVWSGLNLFLFLLVGRVVIELSRSAEQPFNRPCDITVGSLQSLDCMFLIEAHTSNLRHLARIHFFLIVIVVLYWVINIRIL
mmetsp:Transcript_10418/g.14374  ORF Transcript_10418/g.14374 Transcript_10418/m.14374 type:complete len:212 (+) Transcript_10418:254-889(+)